MSYFTVNIPKTALTVSSALSVAETAAHSWLPQHQMPKLPGGYLQTTSLSWHAKGGTNHAFNEMPPPPRHMTTLTLPGIKRQENGSTKGQKLDVYQTNKRPLSQEEITARFLELFPGEPFETLGSLEKGLVIYSTVNDLHLIAIPSSALIPSAFTYLDNGRITGVTFGGNAGLSHIKYSLIESPTERSREAIAKCVAALMSDKTDLAALYEQDRLRETSGRPTELILNGALLVGFEREFWAIDPKTGELADIRHDELLVGCIEIDEGHYITPAAAAVGMALKQKAMEDKFNGLLLVNTGTPPSATPQNMEINVYNEPEKGDRNLGPYIAVIAYTCWPRYGPRTKASWEIREQQAKFHGFDNADDMKAKLGDIRTWSNAAAHMNLGLPNTFNPERQRYEINFELARNVSNLVLSELGAMSRMMTASTPFLTGFAPTLDGRFVRDTREFTRNDLGTALSHNEPIRDARHYREIVSATMTAGKDGADRLSRAIIAHKNKDGTYSATAHGAGRWRFEETRHEDGRPKPAGRIEYTAAPATSILPKARSMAVLQMLEAIALIATHENKDVFDYIEETYGYSKEEVWGNADATVQEYLIAGPQSPRTKRLGRVLTDILTRTDIPALREVKKIALAGIRDLFFEGDIHDFAKGKGTLGAALIPFAEEGYSGLAVARIVDAFLRQEAQFIASLSEEDVNRYLRGEIEFEFKMPDQ